MDGGNEQRVAIKFCFRMVAESLNIPKTVVLRILKEDFGKRNLCARFFPHLSEGKIESHPAKTLSRWPMQTK
jgi:hypothetical protein